MKETDFDKTVRATQYKVPEVIPNALKDALELAENLTEQARFNEAIRVIETLETKVQTMPIASRFSNIRTMRQGQAQEVHPSMMDQYLDMTEAEYKNSNY